jgi:hypothetical protein
MVKCKTNEVEQGRGLFVLVGAQNKNEAHCANAVVLVSERCGGQTATRNFMLALLYSSCRYPFRMTMARYMYDRTRAPAAEPRAAPRACAWGRRERRVGASRGGAAGPTDKRGDGGRYYMYCTRRPTGIKSRRDVLLEQRRPQVLSGRSVERGWIVCFRHKQR